MMQKVRYMLAACGLVAPAAQAAVSDPVWQKTQALFKASSGMVARQIDSRYVLQGGDERMEGHFTTVIVRVENGDPVRQPVGAAEQEQAHFKQGGRLDFKLARNLANHPDSVFAYAEPVAAPEPQTLQGKTWLVLSISDPGGKDRLSYSGKAWVDPATGAPLKIEGTMMTPKGMPGVKSFKFLVAYGSDKPGLSLPRDVTVDYVIDHFFQKGTASYKQQLSGWDAR
jgi:hypothetical protein